jgi:hypothetical protein
MHYGEDETQAGLPFVRLFNPTEFDTAISKMISEYNAIKPWYNLNLFSTEMQDWLTHVIDEEKIRQTTLTAQNAPDFNEAIKAKYPDMDSGNMIDYTTCYLNAQAAGAVAQAISHPWTYTPTEGTAISDAATGVVKSVTPLILGAVAVYALFSAFLPNLIGKVAHR